MFCPADLARGAADEADALRRAERWFDAAAQSGLDITGLDDAAQRMATADSGIIALVDDQDRITGIVTPRDLCGVSGGSLASFVRPCPPTWEAPLTVRDPCATG